MAGAQFLFEEEEKKRKNNHGAVVQEQPGAIPFYYLKSETFSFVRVELCIALMHSVRN